MIKKLSIVLTLIVLLSIKNIVYANNNRNLVNLSDDNLVELSYEDSNEKVEEKTNANNDLSEKNEKLLYIIKATEQLQANIIELETRKCNNDYFICKQAGKTSVFEEEKVKELCGEAIECFKGLLKLNVNGIAHKLGDMFYFSDGILKNLNKAFNFYNLSVLTDEYLPSYKSLGDMYRLGHGTEQNFTQSYQNYKTASNRGYGPATYWLAKMHQNGLGVEQNHAKALELYKESSKQGYSLASYILGALYSEGDIVVMNNELSKTYFKKAYEQEMQEVINSEK